MNYIQQKQLQNLKQCIVQLQHESKLFENQRQHLFRDLSKQINYLINNFSQLAHLASQNHQQNTLKISKNQFQQEKNKKQRFQQKKQKEVLITNNLHEKIKQQDNQINYFIEKLQQKNVELDKEKEVMVGLEERVKQLQKLLIGKEKQLQNTMQLLRQKQRLFIEFVQKQQQQQQFININNNNIQRKPSQIDNKSIHSTYQQHHQQQKQQQYKQQYQQQQQQQQPTNQHYQKNTKQSHLQQTQSTFQQSLLLLNNTNIQKDQQLKQLLNKISVIQNERDMKIEQLQLMQKHYDKQVQNILIDSKDKLAMVIKEKDDEIERLTQQLLSSRQQYNKQLLLTNKKYNQQTSQLKRKNRNEIDQVSLRYQKQIVKLSSKYQNQIDNLTTKHVEQIKQHENKCNQMVVKVRGLEQLIERNSSKIIGDDNKGLLKEKMLELEKKQKQLAILVSEKDKIIIEKDKIIIEKDNQLQKTSIQINKLSNSLKQLTQQSNKLSTTNNFLQTKNHQLFNQLQKQKLIYEQFNTITIKQTKQLQTQLQQNKKIIIENKKSLISLNNLVENLKRQLSQKDIKIESLQRQLQRTKNYNQILLSDVKTLNSDVKTLNSKIKQLDQSNHQMRQHIMLTSRENNGNKKIIENHYPISRILNKVTKQSILSNNSNIKSKENFVVNNNKSNIKQKKSHTSYFVKQNQSLLIDRNDNSLVIDNRNDNSLVLERKENSMILQKRSTMLRDDDKSRSKSKSRINVAQQLRKRKEIKQTLSLLLKNKQYKKQQNEQKDHQASQQQLVHLYSMQTTFSPMIIPNKQENHKKQDKLSTFMKKNEKLEKYRQKYSNNQNKQKQRNTRSYILLKDKNDQNKKRENIGNFTDRQKYQQEQQNIIKVSQQFKNQLKAHDRKKSQYYQFDKINQSILKSEQSRQILVKEIQLEAQNGSHSSLQGQYQYDNLKLTFKPKIVIDDKQNEKNHQIHQRMIKNHFSESRQKNSIQDGTESIQICQNGKKQNNLQRFLSLDSSFEDQNNNISHQDLKSNNLRNDIKEKMMRQLPVHLLMRK